MAARADSHVRPHRPRIYRHLSHVSLKWLYDARMRTATMMMRLGMSVGVVLCGGHLGPGLCRSSELLLRRHQRRTPERSGDLAGDRSDGCAAQRRRDRREGNAPASLGFAGVARGGDLGAGTGQQDAIQTLDQITKETDYRLAMAFGLPYGVESLALEPGGIDIISADLHVDLDIAGTPLLAGADLRYQSGVSDLFCLVHVEATRLAAEGDVGGALELLADGVFFARQLVDRQFAEEMIFGIQAMKSCFERMRDGVYIDLRGERALTDDQDTLSSVIDRVAERTREGNPGYVGVERMTFPMVNRLAGDQLVDHVLIGAGANPDTFVRTMAFLTSRGNPMMLFSQSPRWEQASDDLQLSSGRARTHVDRIHSDYIARWNLRDPHDPLMSQQTHYEQLQASGDQSLIALDFTMGALADLLDDWQQIRLEAMGTRHALALAAYTYAQNQHAPSASSVRPRWLPVTVRCCNSAHEY